MIRIGVPVFLVAVFLAGCGRGTSDVQIISKDVRSGANVSAAVPDEFAGAAGSTTQLYWIEGQLHNRGTEELRNVSVTFRCTDGNSNRLFVATIERIPAGATVPYSTERYPSPLTIRLLEGEPEISIGR
jgi:hypothetical protein